MMLVICTLGYSSVWAYDGHAVVIDEHASAVQVDNIQLHVHVGETSTHEDTNAITDTACDHCGHISAHLQAIFSQSGYLISISRQSELLEFSETFVSYIVSPDLRPPRV